MTNSNVQGCLNLQCGMHLLYSEDNELVSMSPIVKGVSVSPTFSLPAFSPP